MTGTWKPVPGFPGYERSPAGDYRSWRGKGGRPLAEPRPIKVTKNRTTQYLEVKLQLAGASKHVSVARGILEDNVGPCPPGMEVRHLNGVRTDNRWPDNIEWATHADNMSDCDRHGTLRRGERHHARARPECMARGASHGSHTMPHRRARGERSGTAKLSSAKVDLGRWMLSLGIVQRAVAFVLGIGQTQVSNIKTGKQWAEVQR